MRQTQCGRRSMTMSCSDFFSVQKTASFQRRFPIQPHLQIQIMPQNTQTVVALPDPTVQVGVLAGIIRLPHQMTLSSILPLANQASSVARKRPKLTVKVARARHQSEIMPRDMGRRTSLAIAMETRASTSMPNLPLSRMAKSSGKLLLKNWQHMLCRCAVHAVLLHATHNVCAKRNRKTMGCFVLNWLIFCWQVARVSSQCEAADK